MREVVPRLFVGSAEDYASIRGTAEPWSVVQACKHPFHREALGYTDNAAPKGHPEYLIARRDDRLILNLIDARNPALISHEIMREAVAFVARHLDASKRVLVHCNQGRSRGPGIAMLYLGTHTDLLSKKSFEDAFEQFCELYPEFMPGAGIREYLRRAWLAFMEPAA